jgi:ABC-type transport system involved in multi-copper enzyme maturation permease subunit
MVAKEWRDARWKLVVGTLLFLALVTSNLAPYKDAMMSLEPPPPAVVQDIAPSPFEAKISGPAEWSVTHIWFSYNTGKSILALIAVVLAVGFVSGEVSRGTIFLLLSKPVGRVRVFLVKYGIGALVLLAITALGSVGTTLFAVHRGYPLGHMSVVGVTLSTLLLWLGALSIFGLALLVSVVFEDAVKSTMIILPLVLMIFALPLDLQFGTPVERTDRFLAEADPEPTTPVGLENGAALAFYWSSENVYQGEESAPTYFLICLVAAVLPLLAGLLMCRRKAY